MKKKRITYGVFGMMEYQALIPIGKTMIKVSFTEGSMTAIGVNPATFTTDSFIIQQAIERSSDYRRGRIHKECEIELGEELRVEHNKHIEPVSAANDVEIAEDVKDETAQSIATETVSSEPKSQPDGTDCEVELEFSNNDDAKDYLETTFGVKRSKMRNRSDIEAYGHANGVSIHFTD